MAVPPVVLQSDGQDALVSPLSQIQFRLQAVVPVLPLGTHEPAVPAGGTYQVHPETMMHVACVDRPPHPKVTAPTQSAGQLVAVSVPLQI